MTAQSEKEESLMDIVKGKNIQKKYELYQIGQGKELLLIIVNLCIIGVWFGFTYLWAKAAAYNAFLEWLFMFGKAPGHPPLIHSLLFGVYLLSVIFWLLPKLEIKMADKIVLRIKDSQMYIETPKQTTSYARCDIRKIELRYRYGDLREIVIHTKDKADTVFCRPKLSIPHSKCGGNVNGFTAELITVLHMCSKIQSVGKWLYREYS